MSGARVFRFFVVKSITYFGVSISTPTKGFKNKEN